MSKYHTTQKIKKFGFTEEKQNSYDEITQVMPFLIQNEYKKIF